MSKIKRLTAVLCSLALSVIMFAGCSGKAGGDGAGAGAGAASATAAATAAANDAGKSLVFAITGFDTKNFYPATSMTILNKYVLQAVYEALIEVGNDGSLQPAIAESYKNFGGLQDRHS